jgi:hypothetical protein
MAPSVFRTAVYAVLVVVVMATGGCVGFQAPIDPDDYPDLPAGLRVATVSFCFGTRFPTAARVMNINLHEVGYGGDFVLIVDSSVDDSQKRLMEEEGIKVVEISALKARIPGGHASHIGKNMDHRYKKLFVWMLTEYDRVVYLDLDIVVLESLNVWFHCPTEVCVTHDYFSVMAANTGVISFVPSAERFSSMMSLVGSVHSYDSADQGFLNHFYGFNDTTFLARNSHISSWSFGRIYVGEGDLEYLGKPMLIHVAGSKWWHFAFGEYPLVGHRWARYRARLSDGGVDSQLQSTMATNSAVALVAVALSAGGLVLHDCFLMRRIGPRHCRLGVFPTVALVLFVSFMGRLWIMVHDSFFVDWIVRFHMAAAYLCIVFVGSAVAARRAHILRSWWWWVLVTAGLIVSTVPVSRVDFAPRVWYQFLSWVSIFGLHSLTSLDLLAHYLGIAMGGLAVALAGTALGELDIPSGDRPVCGLSIATLDLTWRCCTRRAKHRPRRPKPGPRPGPSYVYHPI